MKKIYIGADSAGFEMKEMLRDYLTEAGHEVIDVGTDSAAVRTPLPVLWIFPASLPPETNCLIWQAMASFFAVASRKSTKARS